MSGSYVPPAREPSRPLDRSHPLVRLPDGRCGPAHAAVRETQRGATWSAGSTASRRRETGTCGGGPAHHRPLPDAVTVAPTSRYSTCLLRIVESWRVGPGLLATLDLADQVWSVLCGATRSRRPATSKRTTRSRPAFASSASCRAAWCRAWGGPAGVLPTGLRRAAGVTVLGREGDAGFADGAIVHCTEIGGTAVVELWIALARADIADAAPTADAWTVNRAPRRFAVAQRPSARRAAACVTAAALSPSSPRPSAEVLVVHVAHEASPRGL